MRNLLVLLALCMALAPPGQAQEYARPTAAPAPDWGETKAKKPAVKAAAVTPVKLDDSVGLIVPLGMKPERADAIVPVAYRPAPRGYECRDLPPICAARPAGEGWYYDYASSGWNRRIQPLGSSEPFTARPPPGTVPIRLAPERGARGDDEEVLDLSGRSREEAPARPVQFGGYGGGFPGAYSGGYPGGYYAPPFSAGGFAAPQSFGGCTGGSASYAYAPSSFATPGYSPSYYGTPSYSPPTYGGYSDGGYGGGYGGGFAPQAYSSNGFSLQVRPGLVARIIGRPTFSVQSYGSNGYAPPVYYASPGGYSGYGGGGYAGGYSGGYAAAPSYGGYSGGYSGGVPSSFGASAYCPPGMN